MSGTWEIHNGGTTKGRFGEDIEVHVITIDGVVALTLASRHQGRTEHCIRGVNVEEECEWPGLGKMLRSTGAPTTSALRFTGEPTISQAAQETLVREAAS